MAKTKGPLLSLDAHGSLSKLLTFSNKRTGQQVRKYNKPLKVPSAKQRGQRRLTEFLVAQWQNMTAGQRATWEANAKASDRNLPGYQYFLREAQRDLYTHHGLVGYWSLNEIVSNQVLDISGNALHLDLKPTPPANAPSLITGPYPKFSKALIFDGVDELIEHAHNAIFNFGTGPFSAIAWAYINGSQNNKDIIGKIGYISAVEGWQVTAVTGPNFQLGIGNGTNNSYLKSQTVVLNTWYQVAVTRKTTAIKIYVNGQLSKSDTATQFNINNTNRFSIGAPSYGGNYLKGSVDEARVYNRELSAAEILTGYKFALNPAS